MDLFNHFIRMSEKPVNSHMYIHRVLRSWDYISGEEDAQSKYDAFIYNVELPSMIRHSEAYIYNAARGGNPLMLSKYDMTEHPILAGLARSGNLEMLRTALESSGDGILSLTHESSEKIMLAAIRGGNLQLIRYIYSVIDDRVLKHINRYRPQCIINTACRTGKQEVVNAMAINCSQFDHVELFNHAVKSENVKLVFSMLASHLHPWKPNVYDIHGACMMLDVKGNQYMVQTLKD
jgi:hypothetical protein